MAKLRKFSAYRRVERPYTRKSKYTEKSYIRTTPTNKVIRYHMGNQKKDYTHEVRLNVKDRIQIRHNALESARLAGNRSLDGTVGKDNFWLRLRVHPHHVLRENPLASGAGADRMSTGMKCSFGKVIGIAAQMKKGQTLFSVRVFENNVEQAREALRKMYCKLPVPCSIEVVEITKEESIPANAPKAPKKEAKKAAKETFDSDKAASNDREMKEVEAAIDEAEEINSEEDSE